MSRSDDHPASDHHDGRHSNPDEPTAAFLAEMDRITAEHFAFPDFEPYASMPRERIIELIDEAARAGDARKALMLQEFLLDRMSEDELDRYNAANELSSWLMERFKAQGNEQCMAMTNLAVRVVNEAAAVMARPS